MAASDDTRVAALVNANPRHEQLLARMLDVLQTAGIAVAQPNGEYEAVAASQTNQTFGATGGLGDYLSHLIVTPTTLSPGVVQIKDGSDTAITLFAGGASSLTSLAPFTLRVEAYSRTGAWQITTGAGLSVVAVGNGA